MNVKGLKYLLCFLSPHFFLSHETIIKLPTTCLIDENHLPLESINWWFNNCF